MKILGFDMVEVSTPAIHPPQPLEFEVVRPSGRFKIKTKRHPNGRIEITGPPEVIKALLDEARKIGH